MKASNYLGQFNQFSLRKSLSSEMIYSQGQGWPIIWSPVIILLRSFVLDSRVKLKFLVVQYRAFKFIHETAWYLKGSCFTFSIQTCCFHVQTFEFNYSFYTLSLLFLCVKSIRIPVIIKKKVYVFRTYNSNWRDRYSDAILSPAMSKFDFAVKLKGMAFVFKWSAYKMKCMEYAKLVLTCFIIWP